ncbi:MAG TPA: hypothetical protein VLV50_07690 [Stellaceae bacterium]|nr:hypothetical protein [Stellaceae bacterium]
MTKRNIASTTRLAAALALVSFALAGCGVYGYATPAPYYGPSSYGYGYYAAPYANSSGDYDWHGGNGGNYFGG